MAAVSMAPNAKAAIMIRGERTKNDSKTTGEAVLESGGTNCGPGASNGIIPEAQITAPAINGAHPETPKNATSRPPAPNPAARETEYMLSILERICSGAS